MKLPLREFLEAGEAPRDPPFGDPPRGEDPLGDRPRGEEAPLRKTSLSAGSGVEAKRADVNTWVGCRKAPPRPLTTRCSGSKGCRFDCPWGCIGGRPALTIPYKQACLELVHVHPHPSNVLQIVGSDMPQVLYVLS